VKQVKDGRSVRRQSCETARKKYNFVVPEVIEAECGRGATESASRRRELLGEVSFFAFEREDTGISAAAGGSGCDPG
jgi:hypothetical protein